MCWCQEGTVITSQVAFQRDETCAELACCYRCVCCHQARACAARVSDAERFARISPDELNYDRNDNSTKAVQLHLRTYERWSRLRYPTDEAENHKPMYLDRAVLVRRLKEFALEVWRLCCRYNSSNCSLSILATITDAIFTRLQT